MKMFYPCVFCLLALIACISKSKYQKAADEMAAKLPPASNTKIATEDYSIFIPPGWKTEHRTAYGMNFYYLLAPKTPDNPNTNVNVLAEYMQNLTLEQYRQAVIESILKGIPTAEILGKGDITANGLRGAWYCYSMEPLGLKSTLVGYIFPKNGVAYLITAGTQTKDFGTYRSLFDSIARSLKFKND